MNLTEMDSFRTPSVFEILACNRLKWSLREAIRYLLDSLRTNDSEKKFLLLSTDEIVFLLDLLIEYNYLRSYESSYSENLYGLIRKTETTTSRGQAILLSLIPLVFIPYVKHKVDKYFERLNYKEVRTAEELRCIRLYRIISKSCCFLDLLYLVRFASGKSDYHHISESIMKIHLKGRPMTSTTEFSCNDKQVSSFDRLSRLLADIFGRGLTIGSYIIQFLDHWNTHSNSASILKASLPIPDPPEKDKLIYSDEKSSSVCLICLHVRQNECVLSNTGYVFCYSCLQRYVKTKQRCPVTGQPTTLDNIVKLFTIIPS